MAKRDWPATLADAKARRIGVRALARELGLSKSTVSEACKRHGVELPKPLELVMPTLVEPFVDGGEEEWRAVPGWEGLYEVSSLGSLRNARTLRVKKPAVGHRGYYLCSLYRVGVGATMYRQHRLVALAFISNPHGHPHVNHLDCNKQRNAASNLEWTTSDENFAHGLAAGVSLARNNPRVRCKLSAQNVVKLRESAASGVTQAKLAEEFGISLGHAGNVIRGTRRGRG